MERRELPWFLGSAFTCATAALGAVVWVGGMLLARQADGVVAAGRQLPALGHVALHLGLIGAVLGVVAGYWRVAALSRGLRLVADHARAVPPARPDGVEWAVAIMSATRAGQGSLLLELLALLMAIVTVAVTRQWAGALVLCGAFLACEQAVHLSWLCGMRASPPADPHK